MKIPVIFRISVDDYFPEGLPEADGIKVAVWAGQAHWQSTTLWK